MAITEEINSGQEVSRRFSNRGSARRWNDMYATETPSAEEHNYRCRRDRALQFLLPNLPSQGRVLDLGCGAGPTLLELRRRGIDCVGVDASADMLEYAGQRLREHGLDSSGLLQSDCRQTPFPDAHFDAVLCIGVISYLPDYELALREIRRILKPGGLLIISWRNATHPAASDPVRIVRGLSQRLKRRRAAGQGGSPEFTPGRHLNYRKVTRKMERLGFRYVQFAGIGFGPYQWNGTPLFSEARSIRISDTLSRILEGLRAQWLIRQLTDVSLWSYRRGEDSR
ncbi:MAG: class I SAM-dependent methyltransferase [Verrucomicrobiales bacterium]|nr:class I SAM-dependent methyltransferase [Verrucomicrobiales bacterium]